MPRRNLRNPVAIAAAAAVAIAAATAASALALYVTLPDPAPLAKENPRTTELIEQRRREAKELRRPFRPRQTWVPFHQMSPNLVQAVLLSEDANFYGHDGIDWDAMREAAEHDLRTRRFARGASTITQQLAKNLWLGTEKSLSRKVKEAMLAAKLERSLTKRRILVLYLNVVELDDGVFGAEAGARHRFGVGAGDLSAAQAVVLASSLPAPRKVDLRRPSSWLRRRARALLDRMRAVGRISAGEHLHASAELERILAGPTPAEDVDEPPDDEGRADAPAPRLPPARAPAALEASPEPPAAPPGGGGPASVGDPAAHPVHEGASTADGVPTLASGTGAAA